jgi:hypothetical protein
MLSGLPESVARLGIPLVIFSLLPVPAYRETMTRARQQRHPIRSARDCVLQVQAQPGVVAHNARGMYVDDTGSDYATPFNHEYAYYFRKVQPWMRPNSPGAATLEQLLYDPALQRPVLVSEARYHAAMQSLSERSRLSPPLAVFESSVLFLLPGPYTVCSPEVGPPRQGQ